MTRNNILHQNRTAAGCNGCHEGARLDLIRNDGVIAAMQALYTANLDHISTGALNIRAHCIQEVRQIDNVRLLRAVLHNRLTLGQNSCEHDVHGRADRNNVKINMCAVQTVLGCLDPDVTALGQRYLCAQSFKTLDVLVDRTDAAEVAAAWHCYLGKAVLAEQHAEQIVGCAQLALQLVRLETRVLRILDFHRSGVDLADLRAQLTHDLHLQRYINDLGHVFKTNRAICQQSRRNDCDRCILCAGDGHLTIQRLAAVDYILCQSTYSSLSLGAEISAFFSEYCILCQRMTVRADPLCGQLRQRLNPFA